MQLGNPTVLEASSGEAVAVHDGANGGSEEKGIIRDDSSGGGGAGDGDGDESHEKMNGGGNRWPRQETLALLKIRSDMDAVFRDSSLKGPLWEDVSRKLASLGYHRSAKKCKEKFENVYKYHKRTKESRSGKSEGKTYRFFDQLQALEKQFNVSSYSPKPQPTFATTNNNTVSLPTKPSDTNTPISFNSITTVPSTNPTLISPPPPPLPLPTNSTTNITFTTTTMVTNPSNDNNNNNNNNNNVSYSLPYMNLFSTSSSTSSSTASDEDLEEKYRKKRKWKDYFRRLTRQVLAKQEEMQKKFLEAIDKREREHMVQQDAWRIQEMARINREHELLVQERTTAAAEDAAVVKFLQKLSGQQNPTTQPFDQTISAKIISPPLVSQVVQPQPQQQHHQLSLMVMNNNVEIQKTSNGHNSGDPLNSPSRWPKAEVHALIRLRTSLDAKYQENAPKAPFWEDISAGMQRLGYNRSAKRCKEKWENINKYFKKVKESNKKRREDSKTCPYFEELDALYKEKSKTHNPFGGVTSAFNNVNPNEMMEPLMVQPEQQWRPPSHDENNESQKREREEVADEGDSMEDDNVDDDGEEDRDSMEDEEGRGNHYEIATNTLPSVDIVE
ncbi:hypothetical protein TanjilG_04718 [Lupinus angustifolius]|uniref:Myb-like domain-containing protein n=1 Tax=Lupinus angustifolius TaxID=3871 RepID=A0A4P1RKE7_LUPAN|nr:PREDICTED: trihelix transcription factor GT-2-like [Lupinus angustifolius]OIW12554.1 hypothetical protein TanjilG_04718 [Lupinus angustifolius]